MYGTVEKPEPFAIAEDGEHASIGEAYLKIIAPVGGLLPPALLHAPVLVYTLYQV